MLHLQAYLTATLFGLMASGAAVLPQAQDTAQSTAEGSKLFSGMAVGGGGSGSGSDLDNKPDEDVCFPNQTVLTCAKNIAKTWQIPTSVKAEPQRLRIPITFIILEGYIEPLVQVEASECSLSNPVLKSQGKPFVCSTYWCQETFSFTSTVTESHAFALGSEFSISLAAEADVPLVAKFTTTISSKESQTWTDTNTVSNSTTETHTWTLQNGEMCQPTVVQYGVQCLTTIRIADDATEWLWVNTNADNNQQLGKKFSCDNADELMKLPGGSRNALLFWQFCQSIKSEAKNATMNIGLDGYQGDGVWSLNGCMWPTMPGDK